jgi:predicted site-specific integrase-resolvase
MPWVKLSKAIDHTGVKSRKTLIRWAQAGEIVGSKGPGGHWFFDLESIDRRLTPTARQKAVDIIRSLQS